MRTGKVFVKYVPVVMGMFPNAEEASRAAECAADQGKFWEMHDRLYASQSEWKRSRSPEEHFRRYAAASGVEINTFSTCIAQRGTHMRMAAANDRANRLGVRATPTFFINGQPVEGALPIEALRAVLGSLLR